MTKVIAALWFAISSLFAASTITLDTRPAEARHSLSACGHAAFFQDIPCSEVDRAITEAAREFRLNETKLRKVIRCESGFNPFNSPGSYYGLGQHLKSEWNGRVAAFNRGYDPDVIGNPHAPFDNARVTAWMAHNEGDWGAWPECGLL